LFLIIGAEIISHRVEESTKYIGNVNVLIFEGCLKLLNIRRMILEAKALLKF